MESERKMDNRENIENIECMDEDIQEDRNNSISESPNLPSGRSKYLIIEGFIFLGITVIIWVGSALLIKVIFSSNETKFDKPFFLTYFSESMYSVYLFSLIYYCCLNKKRGNNSRGNIEEELINLSDELINVSDVENGVNRNINGAKEYSLWNIFKLSMIFAPFMMTSNYLYNLGLDHASVSSVCILSNTSSIFVFILSIIILHDKLKYIKVIAILICFGGVLLIGFSDNNQGGDSSGVSNTLWGDIITLISALLYAIYAVLLKKLIPNEDNFRWCPFFGFVGVNVFAIFWVFFLIFHYSGFERFELPSLVAFGYLLLNSIIGTVISDYFWARSVVLLNPLLNSVGMSLTIPLGMVVDYLYDGHHYDWMYIFGSLLILPAFIIISSYDWIAAKTLTQNIHHADEDDQDNNTLNNQ